MFIGVVGNNLDNGYDKMSTLITEQAETYWRGLCPLPLPSNVAKWIRDTVREDASSMGLDEKVENATNWWFHEWTAINSGEVEDILHEQTS